MLTTSPSEKNGSVDVMFVCAIMHQKHLAQSGRSTRSAVDIFNTLRVFSKEPIRKQEIEWECMNSNLISCSLIGPLVNTRSVLKMSTALRVLRPDCSRCFWWVIARVNVTSTDTFFHWIKLLIFFVFSGILLIIFHEYEQMILFFCRVWNRLVNLHLLFRVKWDKPNALAWIWCLSNALGLAGLGH